MAIKEHLALLRQGIPNWNEWRGKNLNIIPDLSNTNLSGANLSTAKLRGANLSGADLSRANLMWADLDGADLNGADLSRANLIDAILYGAILYGANLSRANLIGANLIGADLTETKLRGANLSKTKLSGANLSGTNLYGADLSETDLSETDLIGANLFGANLIGANLSKTNLSGANLSKTNLSETNLIGANLSGQNLIGRNFNGQNLTETDLSGTDLSGTDLSGAILIGAILIGANLSGANLSDAILSGANLSDAILSRANLIRTQALGTNFTAANFTGACLEDWNINSATKLDNIDCQYVYLRSNEEERRPSSREFAPREFTKLFQKALETVDLIFADGIDWKAFFLSFQELQAEYDEEKLSVQAIEKKTGGAFVIRLELPPEANKAEIERHAKELYEIKLNGLKARYRTELKAKNEQIASYRQQNASLENVIKILGNIPIQNIINVTAQAESESMSESNHSKYDQRNSNNQFIDQAQSGSHPTFNQHKYTPEQKQNLAQAAEEIQQLLNQLAQTNPTTEQVTQAVHQKIKQDPTLKARLLAALKAGGLEALKAIFNNPIFSVPAETIKGLLEAE